MPNYTLPVRINLSKYLLVAVFLSLPLLASSQELAVKTRIEKIQVQNDSLFTTTVSVELHPSSEAVVFPIFYDTELEEVSEIRLFQKKGSKYKLVKNPRFKEESIDIDYITSKKIKSVLIPAQMEAKVSYQVSCKELMYFADLSLFSYDNIDSLKYQVQVPADFDFTYNIINKDSVNYLKIDSLHTDSLKSWNIEVVPLKVVPSPLTYFGIYRNMKVPLMRTIVVPHNYKNKEKEYLNEWYLSKVQTRRGLDSTVIQKVDELTIGLTDPMAIVDALYSYLHHNFKYVGIEIGMGAFVPTHVNEVFLYKQGDCKDLSNLLSEMLNYKGIKSCVAMAATYHHVSNCNFPSLCSANHVVCMAYVNGKPVLLDPTDPVHVSNTAVQSLQDRSIFIINDTGGEYFKVDRFLPEQNLVKYEVDIDVDSENMLMNGGFKVGYNGISGNFLKRQLADLDSDEQTELANEHFKSTFGNHKVSSCTLQNKKYALNAEGQLSVKGKIFNDDNSQYVFLDFLPRLLEEEERETMLDGTRLSCTINKQVIVLINMDKAFKEFAPIEHSFSNDDISLSIQISSKSDKIIACNYEFKSDLLFVDNENREAINDILKSFKKVINEPIILKY